MSRISNLYSAGRAPDALLAQRLQSQISSGQAELLRIQDELVTGRTMQRPSDDPTAAMRAFLLRGLLAEGAQLANNLETSNRFLNATDARLGDVNSLLAEARGAAVAGAQSTLGDAERASLAETVRFTVDGLLNAANAEFQGRRLFAGAHTDTLPYIRDGEFVRYVGDELTVDTFADFDQLIATNAAGSDVFGAISIASAGGDLDVALRPETRIAALHRGAGVDLDAILVSDGISSSKVELSSAETIGDVAALIEANPPPGRDVQVDIQTDGLVVRWNDGLGGTLRISDLVGGTTARRLGVAGAANAAGEIVGRDLDPAIERTTLLNDLNGGKAYARLASVGADNDLIIEAVSNGAEFNNYQVFVLDDEGLQAGPGLATSAAVARVETAAQNAQAALTFTGTNNDVILRAAAPGSGLNGVRVAVTSTQPSGTTTASYDPVAKVFTIGLAADGSSTALDVVNAVAAEPSGQFTAALDDSLDATNDGSGGVGPLTNLGFAATAGGSDGPALFIHLQGGVGTANEVIAAVAAEGTFAATLDTGDATVGTPGQGLVEVNATASTTGGTGAVLDQTGLRIVNLGKTFDVDLSEAETVEDVLNELNRYEYGLIADIDPDKGGIRVRSRISGADFAIGELGGATAEQLGLRTFTRDVRLEDLNRGLGVDLADGPDLEITRTDGVAFQVDLSGAETIGDVLDAINNDPTNLGSGVPAVARLASFGNGIEIVHDDPAGVAPLEVRELLGSDALFDLGLGEAGSNVGFAASPATAAATSLAPAGGNNDFVVAAPVTGEAHSGVEVIFTSGAASGDQALASYDAGARRLTIDVDPAATTTATVVAAINLEGTLTASLDLTNEPGNDGSGLVADLVGSTSTLSNGAPAAVAGVDVNLQESSSAFDTLLRLAAALESGDQSEIERAGQRIQADEQRVVVARAEVGAAQQHLDRMQSSWDDEEIHLKQALSNEVDVDLADAISRYMAQQQAVQAALQTAAQTRRMSLLDFL